MKVRKIVFPGDEVGKRRGRKLGRGVYEVRGSVRSKYVGIPKETANEVDVIPLAGAYLPKVGDKVVGIIRDVEFSGWVVDINSPYVGFLPVGEGVREYVDTTRVDLSKYYDVGDVIFCRVVNVPKSRVVQLSMKYLYAKKLVGGTLVRIPPSKVARLIGKGGSMVELIKKRTKCQVIPGENGVVWVKGENALKAIEAIKFVEKKSHIYGLTQKVSELLR